jgi:hypothetical protein
MTQEQKEQLKTSVFNAKRWIASVQEDIKALNHYKNLKSLTKQQNEHLTKLLKVYTGQPDE